MLKAYISPLGIGYGHASRCLNLARRLMEEGFSISFSAYGDASLYLKDAQGVEVIHGGEEIVWKHRPDGSPDLWGTLKNLQELRKFFRHVKMEKENIERTSPDIVISDSRIPTLFAAQYLGVPSVAVLNQPKLLLSPLIKKNAHLHDLDEEEGYNVFSIVIEKLLNATITRFWGLSQASIVADFPPPSSISKYHTSDLPKSLRDRIIFSGPLIEPKCRDEEGNVVLIIISGPSAERKSLADLIMDLLRDVPEDLKEYEFIVSLGNPSGSRDLEDLSDNVKVYDWLPDKWKYLSMASVVVSRAGHTTITEALMCGKPLLLIPVPGQTEKLENAKSVVKMGLGLMLRQSDVKREFYKALRRLLNPEFKERVMKFKGKFENWDFIDRAAGIVQSVIY